MNKIERVRIETIESGSPLAHHSLNQRVIKKSIDGARRLAPTKYEARQRKQGQRIAKYNFQKTLRILEAVCKAKLGSEEADLEALPAQMKPLRPWKGGVSSMRKESRFAG